MAFGKIRCDECISDDCKIRGCIKTVKKNEKYTWLEGVYMKWIKSLPCSVKGCGRDSIHAHHDSSGNSGLGQKKYSIGGTLPLCVHHHETGPNGIAIHRSKKSEWEKRFLGGKTCDDIAIGLVPKFFEYLQKYLQSKTK